MAQQNTIYCGDNMDWLQALADESVDLCYIDPPFFSKRNYEVIWGNGYEMRSFDDRFAGGVKHYVSWMTERIQLIYRKLKPTGSFYLHCDYHASHYLKVACDKIFEDKNFRNEIVWVKGFRGTEQQKAYQHAHDVLLFYTLSDNYTWNQLYQEYKDPDMRRYDQVDKDGRQYAKIKRTRSDGTVYYGKSYPAGKRIDDVVEGRTFLMTRA